MARGAAWCVCWFVCLNMNDHQLSCTLGFLPTLEHGGSVNEEFHFKFSSDSTSVLTSIILDFANSSTSLP